MTIKFLNNFLTNHPKKNETKKQNYKIICPKDANGMALIRLFLDQTDLGLYCLPKPVCPKFFEYYGIFNYEKAFEKLHKLSSFNNHLTRFP